MVVTFYSYKGGVGRTSLALETAARLAVGRAGREALRVVVWDLDLEAPGVHHFPGFRDLSVRAQAGTLDLLDLLWKGNEEDNRAPPSDAEIDAILRRAIVSDTKLASGRLALLAPNAGGAIARERLTELDLPTLFSERQLAPTLLHRAARRLLDSMGFDVVVVDSRTGLSDLSATAVAVLPDVVVFPLRLDGQDRYSVPALVAAIRSASSSGPQASALRIIPVATFVPNSGEDLERRAIITERCATVARQVNPNDSRVIQIPFREWLLLDESVPTLEAAPGSDPAVLPLSSDADNAYEELASSITAMVADARPPAQNEVASLGESNAPSGRRRQARTAGLRFEERVAAILKLDGWRVKHGVTIAGTHIDLLIEASGRLGSVDRGIVECKDTSQQIGVETIRSFAAKVAKAQNDDKKLIGLFVSRNGFTSEAHRLGEERGLVLETPAAILARLAPPDLPRHAARLVWEHTEDAARYLPLRAVPLAADGSPRIDPTPPDSDENDTRPLLDDQALAWTMRRDRGGLLTVLGDFGAGKTTFCHHLAFRLSELATTNPELPIPLLADLRQARSRALTADGLLAHALASSGVDTPNAAAWMYRLRVDRSAVLIVDGFDELLGYADPGAMRELLDELVAFSSDARIVLTSRTHYFVTNAEATSATRPGEVGHGATTDLYSALVRRGETETLQVCGLDPSQVVTYLERVFAARAGAISKRLSESRPLGAIVERPYLLRLVAGSVDEWERLGWPDPLNLTTVYEAYVAAWYEERGRRNLLRETEDADQAMDIVASAMWRANGATLEPGELAALCRRSILPALGQPVESARVAQLEVELRAATFIARPGQDSPYAFAHRSFLEFFLARSLRRALSSDENSPGDQPSAFRAALATRRFTPEVGAFLLGWEEVGEPLRAQCAEVLADSYEPEASENALSLAVWAARAAGQPTGSVTLELGPAQLNGALLTRAELREAGLAGALLSHADLAGSELNGIDLTSASLQEARLERADLVGARLVDGQLDGASLDGARLDGVAAARANFSAASMAAASLRGADLEGADFHYSICHAANFSGSRLPRANFDNADLTAATLDGTDVSGATFRNADLRAARMRSDSAQWVDRLDARLGWARIGWPATEVSGVPEVTRAGHGSPVLALTMIDGPLLASGGNDSTIRIWDLQTREELQTLTGHTQSVTALAVINGEDGPLLASSGEDETIRIWNPHTGEELQTLTGHTGWVLALAVINGEDGPLLASSGADSAIHIWNPHTGEELQTLTGHTGWVRALAVINSDNGLLLASSGDDETIRIWDPVIGEELQTLSALNDWVLALAVINGDDRPLLASGGADKTVYLWDYETGERLLGLIGHTDLVLTLAMIDDDRPLLASGSVDSTIRIWNPHTGEELQTLTGHAESVIALAVINGDDGSLLASSGDDSTIRIWNPHTGEELQTLTGHAESVRALAVINSDNRLLLASGSADHTIRIWDLQTGEELRVLAGHTNWVRALAVINSDNGPLLASSGDDNTIRIWNPHTGEELQTLTGHSSWVRALAVINSGNRLLLASSGYDSTIRLWDLQTSEAVLTLASLPDGGLHDTIALLRPGVPMTGATVEPILRGSRDAVETLAYAGPHDGVELIHLFPKAIQIID